VAQPLEEAKAKGIKQAPWQYVLPPANKFAYVEFKPEEMEVILSLDAKLFNDMMPWDAIHNSLVDVFALYRTKREALTDTFSAEMKGNLGTSTFTKEEILKIAPRAAELNAIIETMRENSAADSKSSWEIVKRLHAVLKKEFALPYEIEAADSSVIRQGDRNVVRSRSEIRAELANTLRSEPRV
jgi:hypothetical protein